MTSSKKPLFIAHRGERVLTPENTIQSCEMALAQGANALEVDVRLCQSGEVVLYHDLTLYKHFRKLKTVECTTLDELQSMHFSQEKYKHPGKLCTLDEFLEAFKNTVPINLDAKSQTFFNNKFSKELIHLLERHRLKDQVWISSFNPLLIRAIKKMAPTVRTGYLFQDPLQIYRFIDIFLDSDAWHPHHKNLSGWLVKEGRRLNKKMYTWTVNREKTLEKVLKFDIDGIVTDVFFRK